MKAMKAMKIAAAPKPMKAMKAMKVAAVKLIPVKVECVKLIPVKLEWTEDPAYDLSLNGQRIHTVSTLGSL